MGLGGSHYLVKIILTTWSNSLEKDYAIQQKEAILSSQELSLAYSRISLAIIGAWGQFYIARQM